jgi:hypothetical protein
VVAYAERRSRRVYRSSICYGCASALVQAAPEDAHEVNGWDTGTLRRAVELLDGRTWRDTA